MHTLVLSHAAHTYLYAWLWRQMEPAGALVEASAEAGLAAGVHGTWCCMMLSHRMAHVDDKGQPAAAQGEPLPSLV